MKLIRPLHPLLEDAPTAPTSPDDPRPFLERIVETISCPDILEAKDFWEAMNNEVLLGGKLLICQETETGTRVRVTSQTSGN